MPTPSCLNQPLAFLSEVRHEKSGDGTGKIGSERFPSKSILNGISSCGTM